MSVLEGERGEGRQDGWYPTVQVKHTTISLPSGCRQVHVNGASGDIPGEEADRLSAGDVDGWERRGGVEVEEVGDRAGTHWVAGTSTSSSLSEISMTSLRGERWGERRWP